MVTHAERIAGGLVGLLVGDALGVPYEFTPPEKIPDYMEIEMVPPAGFRPAHGVPPGTYSDDGAQALTLLESLLHFGKLVPSDVAQQLVAWRYEGRMALDGNVFDVGNITATALARVRWAARDRVDPTACGVRGARAAGNGSAMRALPLALWHRGSDYALVRDAHRQSKITHANDHANVGCALLVLWARRLLERHPHPWGAALDAARDVYASSRARRCLDVLPVFAAPCDAGGTGWVVDTIHSARSAMRRGSYVGAVRAAIQLGHDTDTTAAVVGGLAGIKYGVNAIPERWRLALRGRDLYQPHLDALLEHHGITQEDGQ